MAIFRTIITFGLGVYAGMFAAQNYEVPRVDEPTVALKKLTDYLEQYKKEKMFENGLEEFDDARATCEELLKEYKACESPDYITYGSPDGEQS